MSFLWVVNENKRETWRAMVEASLRDVLTWRGWVECGTCEGTGSLRGGDWVTQDRSTRFGGSANTPHWRPCPDCCGGLVPPGDQVEAAAVPIGLALGHTFADAQALKAAPNTLRVVRNALVAAARKEPK